MRNHKFEPRARRSLGDWECRRKSSDDLRRPESTWNAWLPNLFPRRNGSTKTTSLEDIPVRIDRDRVDVENK